MPKPKPPKGAGAPSSSSDPNNVITDPRFSNFNTDPRFRLPSKKYTRTKIDKRFSRMLEDDDFADGATVDRYGRKLDTGVKKKALERLYVPDDEGADEEQSGEDEEVEEVKLAVRKVKKMESESAEEEEESDEEAAPTSRKNNPIYDPARGGGFSSSEDDSDDDDFANFDEDEEEEAFPDMKGEQAGIEMGDVSKRFAVVNLDWDHIRAQDLMAVFSSFVAPGGKILKISVYPSEFGKERMEREELEGPPKELFGIKKRDEVEDRDSDPEDEEELEEKIKKDLQKGDNGEEFDSAALRRYQLERLRYFYAVVTCSDEGTAQNIYESTDGTEYLSSANFFDLRFIPDGVDFDDEPRDECMAVPEGYRPNDFTTSALQHSKVKLTWDMTPDEATRKDAINRAFTGSRADLVENDLRAYIGSDSEASDEEVEVVDATNVTEVTEEEAPKLSKKEMQRLKMRAALGLPDEPAAPTSKKEKAPVGDMQITFSSGLTETKSGVFKNAPVEETTAEAYIRKEKERKARKKEKRTAIREGRDPAEEAKGVAGEPDEDGEKEDLGFDDPFFAIDEPAAPKPSKKSKDKASRAERKAAKEAEAAKNATERAELELLMQDNSTEAAAHLDHFDMKEIARMEKAAKKGKKARKLMKGKGVEESEDGKRGGLQKGFEMDVGDSRFGALFESHEFAIDPSNPKFVGTEGMKKLLEEGRRKRGLVGVDGDEVETEVVDRKKRKVEEKKGKSELSGLVESLKRKSRV